MKNHYIIRKPIQEGKYARIANDILYNTNLSDGAVRLLQAALNSADNWQIVLEDYSRRFGWGEKKQASVVKELQENGYMIKVEKGKGKKGFKYFYYVSETAG